jgi:hypothetical protein
VTARPPPVARVAVTVISLVPVAVATSRRQADCAAAGVGAGVAGSIEQAARSAGTRSSARVRARLRR